MQIIWVSRHALDKEAEKVLREQFGDFMLVTEEILWPEDFDGCLALVSQLSEKFRVVAGVFPAQAVEAFHNHPKSGSGWVFSPVNRPIKEADTNKVRLFQFVRWACIA